MRISRSTLGEAAPFAALLLSMASLCVGTSFAKTVFPVVGPAGMTALRIGLSALLLVALQRPWRWRLDGEQTRAVVGYGIVLACMNLSFYRALATLPLGMAIAIEFLGPLAVAISGSRRMIDLLWVMLAGGGIAAMVLPGSVARTTDPVGVAFALAAAICWALYILVGKRAAMRVPEGRIVCLGLCVASLIAVPVGVAQAGMALVAPPVLLVGAVAALLCSAVPYSLEMVSLRRLPPSVFGVIVSLEPAIGALAAFAILHERLSVLQGMGMGGVVVASVGASLDARKGA